MSEYAIARICDDQVEEAKALMSRCFDSKYAPIFYLYPDSTLVATYNGRVVAGINLDIYQVHKKVRMGYIGWLYTDSEHRGNGLAKELLKKAISFLQKEGCTSLSACVEGDNPASFKQLAQEGFSILGLWQQLTLFKGGTLKVYHHASRFFDMGYFFWHKSLLTEEPFPSAPIDAKALLITLLGNTLLFFCSLMGWNLLALLGFSPVSSLFKGLTSIHKVFVVAAPSLFLLARTMAMLIVAKRERGVSNERSRTMVYRGWDTAWITAILITCTVGFPFPVPGNLYIKGYRWNLEQEAPLLARMAIASQVAIMLVAFLSPIGLFLVFGLPLLVLDGFFFFYPFSGFNASRIHRLGAKRYTLSSMITLAVVALLLVY